MPVIKELPDVNSGPNRAERRSRQSKKGLICQIVPSKFIDGVYTPPKKIHHQSHFNKPQYGDFTYWWKRLNEAPKQNSKRSKKRGLNAVLSIG